MSTTGQWGTDLGGGHSKKTSLVTDTEQTLDTTLSCVFYAYVYVLLTLATAIIKRSSFNAVINAAHTMVLYSQSILNFNLTCRFLFLV